MIAFTFGVLCTLMGLGGVIMMILEKKGIGKPDSDTVTREMSPSDHARQAPPQEGT
jgi:hypothetical protein